MNESEPTGEHTGEDDSPAAVTLGGHRFVFILYGVVVSVAAIAGAIIGSIGIKGLDPKLFGLIELPPTPIGTALFGAITMGTILGILLCVVVLVSERYAAVDETG